MNRPAFAALLTPTTRGAIAVIRLWGPGALQLADSVFLPNRGPRLAKSPPGSLRLGRVGPDGVQDEVVAFIVPTTNADAPAEPEIELHPHGGTAAVALVLQTLTQAGALAREPSAWLGRHERSRVTTDAWIDLHRAQTPRTAEILLDQCQGALESHLQHILQLLTHPRTTHIHEPALALLDTLLDHATLGTRLLDGWTIALAGRPNVGKSSLLNAMAGFDRAIVHPTPGTTRDVLTTQLAIDGWPVQLLDTAGLHPTLDPIESLGVALALHRQARADLVLLVLDRSQPLTSIDRELITKLTDSLIVSNKADLPPAWALADLPNDRRPIEISAATGAGLEELEIAISSRLAPVSPPPATPIPFRRQHVRSLSRIRQSLRDGRIEAARHALNWLLSARPGRPSSNIPPHTT